MEAFAECQTIQWSSGYMATEVGGITVDRLDAGLNADQENSHLMHAVEDGFPEDSDASGASLKSLWTTLMSGKSRSRHARPCVMDVWIDGEKSRATLTIDGESIEFADKSVLWMFTASSCDCCGLRERELLCAPDCAGAPVDSAKEDFFTKYSSLKAVEAGSDARRIGRIEVMFKDGDALSVGLECASSDVRRFDKVCSSLATLGELVKHASSGCKTRRRIAVNDTCPDCVDEVATKDEADRHMMELLADIEVESVAKARVSVSKRQKRKMCTSMAESKAEPDSDRMCAPAVSSAPDELQEKAVVRESNLWRTDDASANHFENSTEADEVADAVSENVAAERHTMELLADIEVDGVAKARAAVRKRQKKKNRTFMAESKAELDTGCMGAPVEPSAPDESQEEAVVRESDLWRTDDASVNPVEASTEADDAAENSHAMHAVEDGHPGDSDESDASLKSLWTTLMSGKSRSRHARPCVMDVWIDGEKSRATLTIAGDSIEFADKNVLWMFTASSCECCGVRERELLCAPDCSGAPDDSAKADFFTKYSSLKAVEAGSDARRIGRIEVMFKDGDSLSVGLECASGDVPRFDKVCSSLTTLGDLVKQASSGCKTRRRTAVNDTCPDCVDDATAKDEADRHMVELLADIADESAAKARAAARKQQKKKICTSVTESNVEPDTGCMCAPAVSSAPDESQEEAVVRESDLQHTVDASPNPFKNSTEADDVADDISDDIAAERHMQPDDVSDDVADELSDVVADDVSDDVAPAVASAPDEFQEEAVVGQSDFWQSDDACSKPLEDSEEADDFHACESPVQTTIQASLSFTGDWPILGLTKAKTDAPTLPLSTCISLSVQTDLDCFDSHAEVEQFENIAVPSDIDFLDRISNSNSHSVPLHIGDYIFDESTSPSMPMRILSVVPRARTSLPLNTPAHVRIYRQKWDKLRIPTGFALKAACVKAVDQKRCLPPQLLSSSESSDDESESSTVHCQSPCCNY